MRWAGGTSVLLVACMGCVACGGGSGLSRPVAVFPSKSDIESVMTDEAKPTASMTTVDVSSWTIKTSVPAPNAAYPAETPWDHYFVERVGTQGKLSAALRCAATESARYYVEAGGYPDDGTRRYLAERCGSTLPTHQFGYMSGEVPDSVTDSALLTQYKKSLDELVAGQHIEASTELGLGVARAKGKVAVVMFSGRPSAELTNFVPVVAGTSVTLSGKVSPDAAFALALVNSGSSGVATCEPDRRVKLPHFGFTCPFAADDPQARIEIATRKPDRVLMDIEVAALVRHEDDAGLTYEPVVIGSDAVAADAVAFQTALFAELNEVRRAAGIAPFTLEPKQSQVNERLAPHLFVASTRGNSDLADRISLGVLAGWDVGGVIRDGGVYWGSITSTRSPSRYLSYALASPFARFILLDPQMTRVAVGASALPPAGAMALLTTYSLFQTKDHTADENALFVELTKRRLARNRDAPHRVAREVALDTALARVATHTETTDVAMQEAMQRVVATEQRGVAGWVVETADLRQIPWPDSLLDPESLQVEIGVTHYKAPGGAWGQYAVIILTRDPANLKTASRAEPSAL
jgi:hypothetical protein